MAYKPNVDDLRESPAVAIAADLAADAGEIFIVEPCPEPAERTGPCAARALGGLQEAVREADIVALLVAHNQFRKVDRTLLTDKIVIDTVGVIQ